MIIVEVRNLVARGLLRALRTPTEPANAGL
jgi:hypothetical protein